jgi:hypothetical protein
MGFGVLFIAYFLLLNIAYFSFTDAILGFILLIAFDKLSFVNKYFVKAKIPVALFTLLGLIELFLEVYTMFVNLGSLYLYSAIASALRYFLIALFTLFMLLGIEAVSKEVELFKIERRARVTIPFSLTVYLISMLLESPYLSSFFDDYTIALIGVCVLLAFMITVIFNLTVIYGAYANICMPGDLAKKEKASRFKFVESFKRHEDEKRREYLEYKIEKRKGRNK